MNQIQLKTLKFKNIFSYGNKWNTFNFKTGISFIAGKNVLTGRRNFAGKSSLLKIIPFALFGKVDGINKSQIINWKNKKQTEVIITFNKGDVEYIIHRGIKPDIFNVMKDGVELPQSSNKKIFQQEIEDTILKMDFTTFMNIVYCDTNNSASILNASKPIKRDYIEKLFNLSYFTNLKDISNTKKKAINSKIIDIESDIKSCESKIDLHKENRMQYRKDIKKYVDERDELEKSLKPVEEHTNFTEKLKDVKLKQDKVDKDLSKKKILLEKVKSKKFYLSKFKCDESTSQEEIDDLINKISINNLEVLSLEQRIEAVDVMNLDACIEEAKINLDDHKDDLKLKKFTVSNLTKDINKLKKELESKPKDGKCPICLQNVDFKHIESEFNSMLRDKNIELRSLETKIEMLDKIIIKSTKIYEDEKKKRSDYDFLVNSLSVEKTKQTSYGEQLKKLNKLLKKLNKVIRFQQANKKLTALSIKVQEEIDNTPSFKKNIEVLENLIKEHTESYTKYISRAEKIKSIDVNIESLKGYITDVSEQIVNHKKLLDELDRMLKKYNTMLEYVKQVIVLCGDDKAKQYAILNFLPYFNERINHYLNKSGVLFYIKLSGWLDYDILGPGISNCSYDNLSGAERISVDRAIQLASMDVKKSQSSALIDLLILDEVLDSSVDDIGLADMMEIIKAKQDEDQSKVLIVSHRNELGSLNDMFDYHYLVSMDKYSSIKEI